MNTITVNEAKKLMATGKFFSIKNYVKSDGSLRDINARQGVKKHSKGGAWNGNPAKNILIAEPVSPQAKKMASDSNMTVNPYRTLKLDSLIGCELRAGGKIYTITA
jgi:hypothetical protein